MADYVNHRWISFSKLEAGMRELRDKIERQARRESMRKVMTPIVKTARQLAPVEEVNGGDLRKSLKSKVATSRDKREIFGLIGPDRKARGTTSSGEVSIPVHYAHLQELGTQDHPAHPFLRPAMDAHRSSTPRLFAEDLRRSLQRVAARVRAKMK